MSAGGPPLLWSTRPVKIQLGAVLGSMRRSQIRPVVASAKLLCGRPVVVVVAPPTLDRQTATAEILGVIFIVADRYPARIRGHRRQRDATARSVVNLGVAIRERTDFTASVTVPAPEAMNIGPCTELTYIRHVVVKA